MASSSHLSSTVVSNVYKSRMNILKQLEQRGYDVSNYNDFGINDVHVMYNNDELDMIVQNDASHKVLVHYAIEKKLSTNHVYTTVSEYFDVDNVLNKETDEIIFIVNDDPNDTLVSIMDQLYTTENKYINIVSIKRLQFNLLEHTLVPKHTILNNEEKEQLYVKFNVMDGKTQMPTISRFDPVAVAIGMRPGDVCEIERPSQTAIQSKYYRYCTS